MWFSLSIEGMRSCCDYRSMDEHEWLCKMFVFNVGTFSLLAEALVESIYMPAVPAGIMALNLLLCAVHVALGPEDTHCYGLCL